MEQTVAVPAESDSKPAEPAADWEEESGTEHALGVDFDGEASEPAVHLVAPPAEPMVEPSAPTQSGFPDVSLEVTTGVTMAAGFGFTFYSILTAFQGESIYPMGVLGVGLLALALYLRSR